MPDHVGSLWLDRAYAYRVGTGLRANDKPGADGKKVKRYDDQESIMKSLMSKKKG